MYVANTPWERIDQKPVEAEWLDEHLIHDHGRLPHEITGLPLRAVHDLEHFDESVGLLDLQHRHGD
jgi:hypothetical protein